MMSSSARPKPSTSLKAMLFDVKLLSPKRCHRGAGGTGYLARVEKIVNFGHLWDDRMLRLAWLFEDHNYRTWNCIRASTLLIIQIILYIYTINYPTILFFLFTKGLLL